MTQLASLPFPSAPSAVVSVSGLSLPARIRTAGLLLNGEMGTRCGVAESSRSLGSRRLEMGGAVRDVADTRRGRHRTARVLYHRSVFLHDCPILSSLAACQVPVGRRALRRTRELTLRGAVSATAQAREAGVSQGHARLERAEYPTVVLLPPAANLAVGARAWTHTPATPAAQSA